MNAFLILEDGHVFEGKSFGEIIPMDNWVTERRLVGILEILIKNVGLNLKK